MSFPKTLVQNTGNGSTVFNFDSFRQVENNTYRENTIYYSDLYSIESRNSVNN